MYNFDFFFSHCFSDFKDFLNQKTAQKITKMASFHPWMVESIEAFSFYCCPECTFRSKEENFFEAHALQNHDSSRYFFQENAEMKTDIKVEAFEVTPDQIGQHFLSNTNVKVNPKKEQNEFEGFIDDEGKYFFIKVLNMSWNMGENFGLKFHLPYLHTPQRFFF